MKYYNTEINMLAGLYDLLVVNADGFPDKELATYTKKQKQHLINNLISFTEERYLPK